MDSMSSPVESMRSVPPAAPELSGSMAGGPLGPLRRTMEAMRSLLHEHLEGDFLPLAELGRERVKRRRAGNERFVADAEGAHERGPPDEQHRMRPKAVGQDEMTHFERVRERLPVLLQDYERPIVAAAEQEYLPVPVDGRGAAVE